MFIDTLLDLRFLDPLPSELVLIFIPLGPGLRLLLSLDARYFICYSLGLFGRRFRPYARVCVYGLGSLVECRWPFPQWVD